MKCFMAVVSVQADNFYEGISKKHGGGLSGRTGAERRASLLGTPDHVRIGAPATPTGSPIS